MDHQTNQEKEEVKQIQSLQTYIVRRTSAEEKNPLNARGKECK
jgi:hypothetical protein